SWALPELAEAPIVYTRVCMYCDTHDGNFWIAPDPEREGLVIAAGDCGHGFKFAPVLGEIIADAVEQKSNPILEKFRWRPAVPVGTGTDFARFRSDHESTTCCLEKNRESGSTRAYRPATTRRYNASYRGTTRSAENLSLTRVRLRSPSSRARFGDSTNASKAAAAAVTSPKGYSGQASPITSGIPPTRNATTGLP